MKKDGWSSFLLPSDQVYMFHFCLLWVCVGNTALHHDRLHFEKSRVGFRLQYHMVFRYLLHLTAAFIHFALFWADTNLILTVVRLQRTWLVLFWELRQIIHLTSDPDYIDLTWYTQVKSISGYSERLQMCTRDSCVIFWKELRMVWRRRCRKQWKWLKYCECEC